MSDHTQQPVAPRPSTKPKFQRKSFGYAIPLVTLANYAKKKSLDPRVDGNGRTQSSGGNLAGIAIRHIESQVKSGLFLHWIPDDGVGTPVLAIATNSSPKYMNLATPEKFQKLKSALEREDDPQWINCRN